METITGDVGALDPEPLRERSRGTPSADRRAWDKPCATDQRPGATVRDEHAARGIDIVDRMSVQSFPASDPPSVWSRRPLMTTAHSSHAVG